MPTARWSLKARKPRPGYPLRPQTIGEHLRRRRMDLGLTRKEAARRLGTNGTTIGHWEENAKSYIRPMFMPAIVAFLGYLPLPEPRTRGEAIQRARLARGWSIARLAKEAGVDTATVRRIEANTPRLRVRALGRTLAGVDLTLERPPVGKRSRA